MSSGNSAPSAAGSGPEFDAYAPGYSAGMEDPIKRLMGGEFAAYMDLKSRWFLRDLARRPLGSGTVPAAATLLDFGCGTGELLQSLRRQGFAGELQGCDVSTAMLEEAARRWRGGPTPLFRGIDGGELPYPPASFDLATVCCVLHHVLPEERPAVYSNVARVLKPAGRVAVFEHNPYNPVTRWIVRKAPIDRNAILVSAPAVRRGLAAAGLVNLKTYYILFFPPRFAGLHRAEALLSWLPLGGQYIVTADKPATTAAP
jgi:SAM-dependent methyltransferase